MVSGSGNDSRTKRNKGQKAGKKPLVFAKDKKQATLALIVMLAFAGNSIFMGVKYYNEQHPSMAAQQTPEQQNADMMAQQQKANLESLENKTPGAATPTPPMPNVEQDANNIYSQTVNLQKNTSSPGSRVAQGPDENIEVIAKRSKTSKNEKMVLIAVTNSGRSNPFLPATENMSPAALSYLVAPPETLPVSSEAGRVMTTIISGILYDKYSPSAIINIEGTDYLVKRGDIINQYKILSIDKSQVLVQLGHNTYKAGVGELLSQTDVNYNTVANLNKKFGGNDVSINVRKKGY